MISWSNLSIATSLCTKMPNSVQASLVLTDILDENFWGSCQLVNVRIVFIFVILAAHLRVLRSKFGKLFLQVRIQREHAVSPVLAGVDHGFQLTHRQ